MTTSRAYIPSAVVATGDGMPSCCARHGRPATVAKRITLFSRSPAWAYALLLFGAVGIFVIVILRKTVVAAAWPFCDACVAARWKQLWIGLGVMAFGVLAITALFASPARGDAAMLAGVVGMFIVMGGSLYISMRFNWRLQSAAEVTKDGSAVLVRQPNPQFAELIPALAGQLPHSEQVFKGA